MIGSAGDRLATRAARTVVERARAAEIRLLVWTISESDTASGR